MKDQAKARWNALNKERNAENCRKWRERNSENVRLYNKKWRLTHEVSYRNSIKRHNRKLKKTVMNHYGGICACCGESELGFLSIDHINGDGYSERKRIGIVGSGFYRWIIMMKYPDNLRVLCMNCNHGIGIYGSCPHINPIK